MTASIPSWNRFMILVLLAVLTLAAPADLSPAAQDDASTEEYIKSVFNAFYRTGLDTGTAYAVTNLAIKKDNMTFLLKSGTVFLMKPLDGEVTGAAFVGEGEASMTPPNRTERYMLNNHYGAETLKEPFTEAVFRFSDGTDKTILAAGKPDPARLAKADRAGAFFRKRNSWLNGARFLQLENQFLEARISGLKGQDFFLGEFHSTTHDWVRYTYNPQDINENSLSTTKFLGSGRRYRVPWVVWHRMADYGPKGHYLLNPDLDGPRLLRIRRNDMDLNLRNTKTVEWDARIEVEALVDGLRCLRFDLSNNGDFRSDWDDQAFNPVRVASVTDDSGQPLEHTHTKDQLMVILPRPVESGTLMTLRIKGSGDVIYQVTAESFGLLQVGWYPDYGFNQRWPFHWTVRVPRPFLITGSGRVIRRFEDQEKKQNGIEIECDLPVSFPWVIFGRFHRAESKYVGEEKKQPVPLTIHSFPTMTVSITRKDILKLFRATTPITVTFNAPPKKIDGFFEEGKEVLKLYENLYGPYPYDELHIAQMGPFLGFGQAPQGFVQLTGEAFMSQAQLESDFFHGFFAHEIAHQWWGHQIGPATRDDEWLSESFAEYAAGIFVNEFQGAKRFQRTLHDWKQNARQSDREAPIAAANTLRGPNAGLHRTNLLYNKGPYVLHMLRVQLDDEKYIKVMRSLQETYRNRNISTEQLIKEINRVTGADYTYFFDQWFWDVGIPKFKYSWRSSRQSDGRYLVTVHVSQEDKEHIKRVLMPVHIHFKGKTIPRYLPVVKAEQDLKIMVPEKPKKVTLDDENTLLAEIVAAS